MNINELTIGEAKELASMFGGNTSNDGLNDMVGKKVIIRTYSAGNFFGTLSKKLGNEVILTNARRLWYWKAAKEISLSAVSLYGLNCGESKIVAPVESIWLEAVEIIPCTDVSIKSIEGAAHEQAR